MQVVIAVTLPLDQTVVWMVVRMVTEVVLQLTEIGLSAQIDQAEVIVQLVAPVVLLLE